MANPTLTPTGRIAWPVVRFIKTSSAWGTGLVLSTGNGSFLVPASNFAIKEMQPEKVYDAASGLHWQQTAFLTDIKAAFEAKGSMRYDGAWIHMLAAALGSSSVSGAVDTTSYTHTLTLDTNSTTIGSAGYAASNDANATAYYARSVKLNQVSISAKSNGPLEMDVKGIADIVIQDEASNTATVLSGNAFADDAIKRGVMFWHGTTVASQQSGFIRILKVTGSEGNCTSSHDLDCTGFKFTLDRPLKGADTQHKTVAEPIEEGQPKLKVEFDIASIEGRGSPNNTYIKDIIADLENEASGTASEYKLEIYLESPDLAGAATVKYSTKYMFPSVSLKLSSPVISNMGMISTKIEATAMKAYSAPNGSDWTGLTNPVYVTVKNKRSTTYIA